MTFQYQFHIDRGETNEDTLYFSSIAAIVSSLSLNLLRLSKSYTGSVLDINIKI